MFSDNFIAILCNGVNFADKEHHYERRVYILPLGEQAAVE